MLGPITRREYRPFFLSSATSKEFMNFIYPIEDFSEHHCPLAVVKCTDFRFREADQKFVEEHLGVKRFDLYVWPGSAKQIISDTVFRKTFIEKIVSVSIERHGIEKLLLLWHWDCGAYGGSPAFDSPEEEEERYCRDMSSAREILQSTPEFQKIDIILAYSKLGPQDLEYIIME